ncbi:MAG: formate dehydrogenase subunit delta, partial [Parvibaculaceae bacterium]
MKSQDMVRMANQIADYFRAYPHEEAVREVANHLKSFWDPRMLKKIFEAVEHRTPDDGLDPLVVEAVRTI